MSRLPLLLLSLLVLSGCAQFTPAPPQPALVENESEPKVEEEKESEPIIRPAAFGLNNPTTFDCGGLGERPCGILTSFFWENGNLFADRGLIATGFEVLPDIAFNANDFIDISQIDVTQYEQYEAYQLAFVAFYEDLEAEVGEMERLVTVEWEALETRITNLDVDDFVTDTCLGISDDEGCWITPPFTLEGWDNPLPWEDDGCIPLKDLDFMDVLPDSNCTVEVDGTPALIVPLPTFEEAGWDVPEDLATFLEEVAQSAARLASVDLELPNGEIIVPEIIKGVPDLGAIPEAIFGDFSSDPDIFDIDSLGDAIDDFQTFFSEDNPFIRTFIDLYWDFVDPPGIVVNDTRMQDEAAAFQDTWEYWALMSQRNLSRYEPLNWTQYINAHNAFNNRADGYLIPNQNYSLTDQLRMGARALSLDIHWYNHNLRLCHGKADHLGCSNVDRYYSSGIKEIGDWLDANPDAVIVIGFEDRSEGHDRYVNDPIAKYLGDKVYTPELGRAMGFEGSTEPPEELDTESETESAVDHWPSLDQILEAGKQMLLFSDDQHGGRWIWAREGNPFPNSRAKSLYFTDANYDGSGEPPAYGGENYSCWSYWEGDAFNFDLSRDDYDLGLFTSVYEARSVIDPLEATGVLRPEEVARLANCPITEIGFDFFNATEWTNPGVCDGLPGCHGPDERVAAMVWSWREDDRGQYGTAALLGTSGRWSSANPSESHRFACAPAREGPASGWADPAGEQWRITDASGPWREGGITCLEEFGDDGYVFAAPLIGWQNQQLFQVAGGREVWLNYNDMNQDGSWRLNRRPLADAGSDQTVLEGERVYFDAGSSIDPDGDELSFHWEFGDGSVATEERPIHVFPDDGVYTVTLTVEDEFAGVARDTVQVTVDNAAPVVAPAPDLRSDEGKAVSLPTIDFNDPGFDCDDCSPPTAESFTATIEWGEGTRESGRVESSNGGPGDDTRGTVAGSHVYGDDGSYSVSVCVEDDDGGRGCANFTVMVGNLEPTVEIDRSPAITFSGGELALLARRGAAHEYGARASDPGSDDLAASWSFPPSLLGETVTYFNNGVSADAYPSPHGTFPFTTAAPNTTVFSRPGVYLAEVNVEDDDGAYDSDSLPLLVTGSRTCTLPTARWSHQFDGGRQLIDEQRLSAYLEVIRFASAVFDDSNLADFADAASHLRMGGGRGDAPGSLRRETLAAWLDFASGGIGWAEEVPRSGLTFGEAIAEVERVVLDGGASRRAMREAEDLARSVHRGSPGNPACD